MAYNTGNPLGSTDFRDLSDNAENFDAALNSTNDAFTDRLGVTRKTFAGMEAEAAEVLSRLGYQIIGDYASGLVMQNYNQVFRKDGELYRASASLALPYTTVGDWLIDEANFVSVGDAALRQDVAARNSKMAFITDDVFGGAGLVADGVDDWQAVFEAAAASSYESIYIPDGQYLLSAGNIDATGKKFWGMSAKDVGVPYGTRGVVIRTTQTTNPVFLIGNGTCLDGLQFFYPDQDGSTITDVSAYPTIVGAPIVYPPTLKGKETGISGFELRNLVFINAYDCIVLGDPTYVNGTGRGTISNVDAFAIYKFLTIYNGLAEIIVSDFVLSPIVYQSVASVGDAKLRKWTQQNGIHFDLHKADGLIVARGTSLGVRRNISVLDQVLSLARFQNVLFDQALAALVGTQVLSNVTFDTCQFYGGTIFDNEPAVDLFTFNSPVSAAGAGGVTFSNCQVQTARNAIFNLVTANCVSLLNIIGGQYANWASAGSIAAPVGAIGLGGSASGVRVLVDGATFVNDNLSFGRGIRAFAGTRLKVVDCDFVSCEMEVETSGVTQVRLFGNTSENTQGGASTLLAGGSVIERGNVWSKPATTKVTNEPWFIALQSAGQSTSGTTPLTMVYQTKNRDGDSSFVAGTGTFTCKTPGSYDMRAVLTHAGGTAGDVFNIELVTTQTTYRKRYTMPATGDSVDIGAVGADMRVGDTAFVRITMVSGTGVFTTSGQAEENTFSGRLVD